MMERSKVQGNERPKFWRGKNLARGVAAVSVMAWIATGTFAVEEGSDVGLQGVFPSAVPAGLSAEEFAKLDGNWATWSQGASEAVADFYAKLESGDVAEQRKAITVLKNKVDVMQRAIEDPRYRSLLQPLTLLHARLSLRAELAEAALDTLQTDPAKVKSLRMADQAKSVNAAIADLRTYLGTIQNGNLWIPYTKMEALRTALATDPASDASVSAAKASKAKLAGRNEISDARQKEFLGRPAFMHLEETLDKYLAVLDWKPPEINKAELRTQLKNLLEAADNYSVSCANEDAAKVRNAFEAITKVSADEGDRLSDALQSFLFNFNVRVIASEEFLNRLLAESRTERGPVVDNVLGAAVSGQQVTATKVGVDLRPSGRTARFDLLLNGTIQSNTVGVTSEASVYTQGNHSFVARKEVHFDGVKFATAPATIQVNPHNTTTGISTNVGGLFSGIAQNVASREVEARRGAAEQIAASRVRDRVLPAFNSEVDKNFNEAGPKLESEVFSGLKATGLYPDAFIYSTTDSTLRLNSRLMAPKELGADLPPTAVVADQGASVLLHETAVNNSIDRIGLEGQTLTESELRAKLEEFFSKALNRAVKLEAPPKPVATAEEEGEDEKGPSAIIFAKSDPMRVHFENGELILVLRAGFKQEGKDDIPTREITVPMTFEVKGPKIVVTRGAVRVVAADGEGGGIAINGVVRKKIQTALPDRETDNKVELKGPKNVLTTQVTAIRLVDGWVQISVQ